MRYLKFLFVSMILTGCVSSRIQTSTQLYNTAAYKCGVKEPGLYKGEWNDAMKEQAVCIWGYIQYQCQFQNLDVKLCARWDR